MRMRMRIHVHMHMTCTCVLPWSYFPVCSLLLSTYCLLFPSAHHHQSTTPGRRPLLKLPTSLPLPQ